MPHGTLQHGQQSDAQPSTDGADLSIDETLTSQLSDDSNGTAAASPPQQRTGGPNALASTGTSSGAAPTENSQVTGSPATGSSAMTRPNSQTLVRLTPGQTRQGSDAAAPSGGTAAADGAAAAATVADYEQPPEDEPRLKYQRLGCDLADLLASAAAACLAVSDKVLVRLIDVVSKSSWPYNEAVRYVLYK